MMDNEASLMIAEPIGLDDFRVQYASEQESSSSSSSTDRHELDITMHDSRQSHFDLDVEQHRRQHFDYDDGDYRDVVPFH